ncbi:hypothetical protein NC653_001673 [Populus alba x Populus x berolinensis]|uniref:Uncharacterized protein n=1 Tax=Populus alba x Populus x berolinensis TaxID=444605 RepID=A0AAD6RLQ9_9ROSI|nr:hypothetical protein NC653_001673 [Populus alba x Populus x berolinensis]
MTGQPPEVGLGGGGASVREGAGECEVRTMRQTSRQSYVGVGDGVVAASAFGVVLCVHL